MNAAGHEHEHEESQRWAAIARSCDDAIVGYDCNGVIVSWNAGAQRIYLYAAEEITGRPLAAITAEDCRQDVTSWLNRAVGGEAVSNQRTAGQTKDGTRLELAVTISPVRDRSDTVIGASSTVREIADQRPEPIPGDERLRQFLADAAHQLRTPIGGIRASAEMLLRGPGAAEHDRLLANLVREAYRAGHLVNSLLQIARLDEGQPLQALRCDLIRLCADEAERTWTLAPGLEIVVHAGELPTVPKLDPDAVREIVANLLDNARRHAVDRIELNVESEGHMVHIKVTDDGPGLVEAIRERAFERFASLDGMGGSGLGLPIARSLARAHGGDVTYEAGGFMVRLPFDAELQRTLERPES